MNCFTVIDYQPKTNVDFVNVFEKSPLSDIYTCSSKVIGNLTQHQKRSCIVDFRITFTIPQGLSFLTVNV